MVICAFLSRNAQWTPFLSTRLNKGKGSLVQRGDLQFQNRRNFGQESLPDSTAFPPRLSPPTPSSPFASASIAKGVTIQTCLCGRGTRPHWVAPKAFAAANRLWHLGVMVAALSARLQCHSASYGDLVLPSSSSFGTPSPTAAAPPSSNQRD